MIKNSQTTIKKSHIQDFHKSNEFMLSIKLIAKFLASCESGSNFSKFYELIVVEKSRITIDIDAILKKLS